MMFNQKVLDLKPSKYLENEIHLLDFPHLLEEDNFCDFRKWQIFLNNLYTFLFEYNTIV